MAKEYTIIITVDELKVSHHIHCRAGVSILFNVWQRCYVDRWGKKISEAGHRVGF